MDQKPIRSSALRPMAAVLATASLFTSPVLASGDVEKLRQLVEQQQEQLRAQQQQLDQQGRVIADLVRKLDDAAADRNEGVKTAEATAGMQRPPSDSVGASSAPIDRDAVGDLNSAAVAQGEFPGSFKIPGSKDVSLAIGGFIKTVAISDSAAEGEGAAFMPASLGTRLPDEQGAFSIDSSLSRLFLDGRAPVGDGSVRGYFEWDLNQAGNGSLNFNLRHAYGSWKYGRNTLLFGHTWSTMMDTKILPEGLTEPTVSGPIFTRQSQVRWTHAFGDGFAFHVALEDPSSADVLNPNGSAAAASTWLPDVVLGIERDWSTRAHVRANTIWRQLDADLPSGDRDRETAWGASLSGYVAIGEGDRWAASMVYGRGLGRYLVGIQSTAGSVVDEAGNEIAVRRNFGVMSSYKHQWSDALRSTLMVGYAKADPFEWQPADTFESTGYASVNLMWRVLPFLTFGVEYGHSYRENQDGSQLHNNRVSVGMQVY